MSRRSTCQLRIFMELISVSDSMGVSAPQPCVVAGVSLVRRVCLRRRRGSRFVDTGGGGSSRTCAS